MSDYIVKDTELTSVANAIRTKGGTNSQLVFPNGFVSAIGNISGGGGSSDFSTAEVTINGIPSADLILANISQTFPVDTVTSMVTITEDTTIVTAVLYKGNSVLTVVGTMVATLSGNIQKMSDTVYLITGDCTITIS